MRKSLLAMIVVTIIGITLALFLSGSASAGALFGSKDIKDNSVQSVDVKDSTLTTADIKDGQVKITDLDPILARTLIKLVQEYIAEHPGEFQFPEPAQP